ncbi:sterol carrier family protein [Gordonia jinhuaensis]|uniref:sterol carrier family protein n=1 Tax=Gordonia jinhuaensis TaxID=1517702 RepID=UPI001666AAF5|nr:sterol carrier family protein [Gordonia jinhuaensis]
MPSRKPVDPAQMRAAVVGAAEWLRAADDEDVSAPGRTELASAVRGSARTLAEVAPGSSVEVRVPPYVAVQCIEGPRHTRGTPPNVVETDPRTWLRLVTGLIDLDTAITEGLVSASGSRARDIAGWLPLIRLPRT